MLVCNLNCSIESDLIIIGNFSQGVKNAILNFINGRFTVHNTFTIIVKRDLVVVYVPIFSCAW